MDSFFFNITDTKYKISKIFEHNKAYINRVDISNGIVFIESKSLKHERSIRLNNLDRMVILVMVNGSKVSIVDHIQSQTSRIEEGDIGIFASSIQDVTISLPKSETLDVFILFIADFFLKRYLSGKENEPIDFLYQKLQKDISFEKIETLPIDALSLYSVEKLLNISSKERMQSIRAENHVIEFIIHCFGLLDIRIEEVSTEELALASKAKNILLQNFISPPTIKEIAHRCATNESKLKKVFKKVYHITLYGYVQKLRLEEANLLLKEKHLTIGEIAKRVGYKHQGYFSKLFFTTYGVYPKALLKY